MVSDAENSRRCFRSSDAASEFVITGSFIEVESEVGGKAGACGASVQRSCVKVDLPGCATWIKAIEELLCVQKAASTPIIRRQVASNKQIENG